MRTQGWGWGGGVSHDAAQASFHKHHQIVFQNDYLFVLPPLVLRGFCFPMFPPTPTPTPTCPQHLVWSGVSQRRHLIARAHQGTGFASLSRPFLLQSAPGHDSIQSRKHGRQEEGRLLRANCLFSVREKIFPRTPQYTSPCVLLASWGQFVLLSQPPAETRGWPLPWVLLPAQDPNRTERVHPRTERVADNHPTVHSSCHARALIAPVF